MGILQGWVNTFRDRYRKHLGREIGRIPEGKRIWIDYEQLRGNDLVTPKTSDDLKDSALLIPILSKSWFASRWCRQEFTTFIAHHSNWQERLFPVWMEPVGSDDLVNNEDARVIWNRLQGPEGLLDYQFWYRDQANQPRTRWFPFVDSTDRGYINTQQDMARDMAERLMQLGQLVRGKPSPAPITPAPSQPSAICDPPIPPFQGHNLVMINGGSSDASLVQEIARILASCEGLGYVVPLVAQDLHAAYKPSELLRDLRGNLKQATAVLMVVHKGPPDQINEQLREYTQAAAKSQNRPPSLDVCLLGD